MMKDNITILKLHHLFTVINNKIVFKPEPYDKTIVYYGYVLSGVIELIEFEWPTEEFHVNKYSKNSPIITISLKRKDGGTLPLAFSVNDQQYFAKYDGDDNHMINYFGLVDKNH